MKNIILPVWAVLVLSSCIPFKYQSICPNDAKINGLSDMMDTKKGGKDTLNIIMMHGMGIKNKTIFDKFGQEIAEQLGLKRVKEKDYYYPTQPWMDELKYKKDSMLADQSVLRILEFQDKKNSKKILRFYSFVWSPITNKSKDWLNNLDDDRRRQKQNHRLKTKVVTEGLTDVVLYQNEEYRRFMQFNMVFAMTHTEAVDPFAEPDKIRISKNSSNANTVIMTTSLGSKFLWDVLRQRNSIFTYYTNPTRATRFSGFPKFLVNPQQLFDPILGSRENTRLDPTVYNNFIGKVKQFVFLSNQLPLLGLTDATPSSFDIEDELNFLAYQGYLNTDILVEANNKINDSSKDDRTKKLEDIPKIFFNDPNDMLGFQVPRKLLQQSDKYVQVQMNYAKKNIFLLASPEKAHEGVTGFNKFIWKCSLFPKFRYRGGKRTATLLVAGYDGAMNHKRKCRCRMTEPSCQKCRKKRKENG